MAGSWVRHEQPRQNHRLGQRDHLNQPRIREQIRIVELDIDHADSVRRLHLADAPQTPDPGLWLGSWPSEAFRQHGRPHPTCAVAPNTDVRGATSFLAESLTTARALGATGTIVVRGDSKFYSADVAATALRHGAVMSPTGPASPARDAAIARIEETAWIPIHYSDAFIDEDTGELISDAGASALAHLPSGSFNANAAWALPCWASSPIIARGASGVLLPCSVLACDARRAVSGWGSGGGDGGGAVVPRVPRTRGLVTSRGWIGRERVVHPLPHLPVRDGHGVPVGAGTTLLPNPEDPAEDGHQMARCNQWRT